MSAKIITPAGTRFARLVVIEDTDPSESGRRKIKVRCDCGSVLDVLLASLRRGSTKSCGCLNQELRFQRKFKHGLCVSGKIHPLHNIWCKMRSRCSDPEDQDYCLYGGRGISVCDRWKDFELFVSDMGDRPQKTTLNRKDNSKGYEPANCEWADAISQARNKRNNRIVTAFGITATLAAHAEAFGVKYCNALYRLKKGWTPERAFTEPVRKT